MSENISEGLKSEGEDRAAVENNMARQIDFLPCISDSASSEEIDLFWKNHPLSTLA